MGEVVEREPGALHSSGETNNTLLVALSSFPHKFKVLLARTCERVCSFVAKFVFCLTGTVPNEAGDHRATSEPPGHQQHYGNALYGPHNAYKPIKRPPSPPYAT
jgi:hypothetical protein